MEKFLVEKKIVSCRKNAKALLGLFAVMCFALSGMILTDFYTEKQTLKIPFNIFMSNE